MPEHLNHSDPDHECYRWGKQVSPFTAPPGVWVVVAGTNFANTDTDIDIISISDGTDTFDRIVMERFDRDVTAAGATTTKIVAGMPRRMLCPPGGLITNDGTNFMSLVECCCLEKALMIL